MAFILNAKMEISRSCIHSCFWISLCILSSGIGFSQSVNFSSSDLPIFVINTNGNIIVDEPKITADLKIIYNGQGKRNTIGDTALNYNGKIGVEYRGSSSQDLSPKKPLGFETRKPDGSNLDVSLLGMPEENDWILLAPYSDKSLMRDVLIHHFARSILPYSSRTRFCEVVINSEYMGVYVLMEKIKRDKNRINIKSLSSNSNAGDALTGGYIVKIDKTTGSTPIGGFYSKYVSGSGAQMKKIYYLYENPAADEITSAQESYISSVINNFESSFFQPDWKDESNGYRKYVDEKSLIDFVLLNEIARNVDGYRLSTFIYKDLDSRDPKLKFGPVWDFNLGFGNANYCEGSKTAGLSLDFNTICPNDFFVSPFFWSKLMQDSSFYNHARTRWIELRKTVFEEQKINSLIDSLNRNVTESQERNFTKWPILDKYVWPNNFVGGTFISEINYLKNWLSQRIIWLDGYFKYDKTVPIDQEKNIGFALYPNPAHDYLYLRNRFDKPLTFHGLVFNSMGIKVLEFNGESNSQISMTSLASGVYHIRIDTRNQHILSSTILKN